MSQSRGFTLMELLVAISIIALLIGILLPALGRARELARDTHCKARISQVFLAQSMYASDHGVFTTIWKKDDGSFSESGPAPATTRLQPYLSLSRETIESPESVLQCPSVSDEELIRVFDPRYDASRPSSIGINGAMHFSQWGFIPERVPRTSQIIVIAEQAVEPYEEVLTADGVGVLILGGRAYWNRVNNHKPHRGYRHDVSGSNVVMADGHVERLAHDKLMHESGHWFWWNRLGDPVAATTDETTGCGCQ